MDPPESVVELRSRGIWWSLPLVGVNQIEDEMICGSMLSQMAADMPTIRQMIEQ
jgi:hypothetical protein